MEGKTPRGATRALKQEEITVQSFHLWILSPRGTNFKTHKTVMMTGDQSKSLCTDPESCARDQTVLRVPNGRYKENIPKNIPKKHSV